MLRITFAFVVTTASVIRARISSKLAGRGAANTVSLTYPHTVISTGVKLGGRGGQSIFHHVQSKQPPCDCGGK